MAEYRAKNKEKLAKKKKEYYQLYKTSPQFLARTQSPEFKAKHIEQQNAYAARNVEKLKEYRRRNSEHRAAKAREWNAEHKEHRRAYMAEYQKKNPEKFLEENMRRRARIYGTSTIGDRKAIVAWMKEWRSKDSVECNWCHGSFRGVDCHADHVIPLKSGGPHTLENLVVSCASCNVQKSGSTPDRWSKRKVPAG